MNETRKRIRAYKAALPGLRERVVAVGLLLAMSIAMMTSASFAWLTISRRPEVTAVNTTVAANGNLEIALASSDGAEPGESAVGDSSAAEGQSVTAANLTWGNLVNLGDPAYGLDNLTLRPAQLNTTALLTSPLYGAVYTADGRVERLTSNFAYTSWVPANGSTAGYFALSNELGVRAVSSTKMELVGFFGEYMKMREAADVENVNAGNAYTSIIQNPDWMNVLGKMMGTHMTATLNSEDRYVNASANQEDLIQLIAMYDAFIAAHEQEALAIANQLNLQLYLAYGGNTSNYTAYSPDAVLSIKENDERFDQNGDFVIKVSIQKSDGTYEEKIIRITNMKAFIKDYNMLVRDVATLEQIKDSGDYRWTASGLKKVINNLVVIDSCLVKKTSDSSFKTVKELLNEFSSNVFSAMGYMGSECDVVITNGVLMNFEQRTGTSIKVNKLSVTAKMYVSSMNLGEQVATIYANITTSATKPSDFTQDLTYADSLNTGADSSSGEVVAEDTYALVVDLWVRTNMPDSYLTLEGNVLTEEEQVVATGKDASGKTVDLYTLTRTETIEVEEDGTTTEETITNTYELYQVVTTNEDNTTTTTWYNAATYTEFPLNEGETPTQKMETIVTVIGYEGENRVWDKDSKDYLTADSTTQGSGSCYVYYADTPEDQARSLELLKALNVAFVDGNGALLATAEMDTERFYAESGRVIVPLVLGSDAMYVGEDEAGNVIRGITTLEKNIPTRITAIVYLNGTVLSNENVLAAADIQGRLNIQFGSTGELTPIDNEALESKERSVSASVSVSEFDYDTYEGDMKTRVTINVNGDKPSTVTAFFLRQINSTQGSREKQMTFTYDEASGSWISDYVFTAPGNYVLRTVQLDGVDYVLNTTPTVKVTGFAIKSLSCPQATNRAINIMTAANSSTVDLNLEFATNDEAKMPKTVQGRFLRDDGTAVNVNFAYNTSTNIWTGSATFVSSGDYTFQYLVVDGEYVQLQEELWQTATIYLGMKVRVYTTSPTSFKYLPSEMTDIQKLLGMQVVIMDNTGEEMVGLTNAKLTYNLEGSGITKMDADLKWNPVSGYYEGELRALESGGPGTWKFNNVTVNGNTITNATESPIFSLISPEPPSYSGIPTKSSYQFAPNGDAKMNVDIKYSATATVQAVIVDSAGKTYEVQGTLSSTDNFTNVTTWNFTIPNGASGTQDGYWTMKEVRIWNYYDAEGNYISAEVDESGKLKADGERDDPMVIDMTGENYTTKVVQTVHVVFGANDGNADKSFNGQFMDTHSVSGINVDIYDYEGVALPNVSGVELVYNYDGNTKDYGHYESSSVAALDGIFKLGFSSTDGKHFVQNGEQSVQYAGNYTPASFSFVANGRGFTYSGKNLLSGIPTITVSSAAPTVKVTGVNPAPGTTKRYYTTATPSNTNQMITGDFNKFTDYNAAVYIYFNTQGGFLDQEAVKAIMPTVTLALSGVPSDITSASMTFGHATNSAYASTFTFNGLTATGQIGGAVDGSYGTFSISTYPKLYPAGKQTVDTISVVYKGMTFNVTLSHEVTINNPLLPPQVTYQINDSTFTGTVPSTVISENGETITVTLPKLATWTADKSTTSNGTFVVQSGYPSTRNVYTERSETNGCDTTYYYTPYIETTTVSKATSTTTSWTNTMEVTGWKIGNTVYKPGETVTVTGSQTITAVITVTEGTKTTTTTTTTRTEVVYTPNGVETPTNPGGTKVDSVTNTSNDVVS